MNLSHVTWTPIVENFKEALVLVFSVIFALIIWAADSILEIFKLYFQFV